MTLHLHIDRVVIDAATGPAPDRARLEEAIRGELTERVAAEGLPAQLRASSARDAATGGAARTETPERGIGHALYGSFHR
jgi:hypothetical protein